MSTLKRAMKEEEVAYSRRLKEVEDELKEVVERGNHDHEVMTQQKVVFENLISEKERSLSDLTVAHEKVVAETAQNLKKELDSVLVKEREESVKEREVSANELIALKAEWERAEVELKEVYEHNARTALAAREAELLSEAKGNGYLFKIWNSRFWNFIFLEEA